MKNKLLSREKFNEMTTSLGGTLAKIAAAQHLSDNEAYEMTILLIKSYINVIVPTKEEN